MCLTKCLSFIVRTATALPYAFFPPLNDRVVVFLDVMHLYYKILEKKYVRYLFILFFEVVFSISQIVNHIFHFAFSIMYWSLVV